MMLPDDEHNASSWCVAVLACVAPVVAKPGFARRGLRSNTPVSYSSVYFQRSASNLTLPRLLCAPRCTPTDTVQ